MDDVISRQAAIATIKGHEMIELDDKRRWYNHGLLDSEVSILDMPTADVRENVKGEWIYTPIENGMIIAMCSICKKVSAITPSVKEWYRFCPNCGADMRGE